MIRTPPIRTGNPATRRVRAARAFTLMELILVMMLLVIVVSITGPSLSAFFKGRVVDNEVRRFIALTRYAQSRAVSEGVPMIVWVDEKERKYGIGIEDSFVDADEEDGQAKTYDLAEGLEIEVVRSAVLQVENASGNTGTAASEDLAAAVAAEAARADAEGDQVNIRFTPDAFLGDHVPEAVIIRDRNRKENESWLAPNRNRIVYEVQTNAYVRR
jgi:Tfp pilus assembly protein FimT